MKGNAKVWAKQRMILIHNMGSVLKTAQAEISRKDCRIRKSVLYGVFFFLRG